MQLLGVLSAGYGDISPSLIGSQITLIAMLFITFAVLPYQTSALASAFSYTSVYTTAHYSRRARGRHVVVTGHLTVATMTLLVEELYHEDYGELSESQAGLHILP